jgi:hypothetical protein
VPRRRAGDRRRRPPAPVRDGLRSPPEHPAVAGTGLPRGGDAPWLRTCDLRSDTSPAPRRGSSGHGGGRGRRRRLTAKTRTVNALEARWPSCFGTRRRCSPRPGRWPTDRVAARVSPGNEVARTPTPHVVTVRGGRGGPRSAASQPHLPAFGADIDPDLIAVR